MFKTYYPKINEAEKVINCLNKEEIMSLHFEEVYTLMIELKSLGEENDHIRATSTNSLSSSKESNKYLIMKHKLYSIFFIKYVDLGLIKEKAL